MNTTSTVVLLLAVFGATAVEMVEALTIVVAAGVTRGWRSAVEGAAVAVAVLTVIVLAAGVPLVHYVPIDALRVVVGRSSSGARTLVAPQVHPARQWAQTSSRRGCHFRRHLGRASRGARQRRAGAEPGCAGVRRVVQGRLPRGHRGGPHRGQPGGEPAPVGSRLRRGRAAAVIVGIIGIVVARQLSRVPENTIKIGVGIMLCSFGLFWIGEGAGLHWPGTTWRSSPWWDSSSW